MRDCSRNFHPVPAWETMRMHSAADIAFGQRPTPGQPESGLSISQMKRKIPKSPGRAKIVFLFDVDNTLLNNDQVIMDLTKYLKREVGPKRARCYGSHSSKCPWIACGRRRTTPATFPRWWPCLDIGTPWGWHERGISSRFTDSLKRRNCRRAQRNSASISYWTLLFFTVMNSSRCPEHSV